MFNAAQRAAAVMWDDQRWHNAEPLARGIDMRVSGDSHETRFRPRK
jgi:hypothetical protein